MGARLRNILAYIWPPVTIDSTSAPEAVDQTLSLNHTSTLDSNANQPTPPSNAPLFETDPANVPARPLTDLQVTAEPTTLPVECEPLEPLSKDVILYEYIHTRLKDILDHRDVDADLRLKDARASLTGIQDPELDALCPHSLLFPQSAYICIPVPVVNKKISVSYNTVSFSDSPDMATTCPSIELLRGVYNSGCHANHLHNTPSWWRCHIY